MIRNLKLLGLAAMAMLAVSAIGAIGVQAATFSASETPVTFVSTPDGTGKTEHQVWRLAGASDTCNRVVIATGTLNTSPVAEIETTSVAYSECNFVGQASTVNMNGCNYNFEAAGNMDINCPAGKEITIGVTNPVCDVVIPSQQNKGTITYTNIETGTSKEITASSNLFSLVHTATGAGCPETGTFQNGELTTGNYFLTGQNHAGTKTINIARVP